MRSLRTNASADTRGARREEVLRKPESELAGRRVPVQRRHQDALSRGADETEDEPVDDRDPEADRKTDHAAEGEPEEGHEQRREREQHDDPAEREVSTRCFAPRLSQEGSASLHGSPRPDLLEDQHRDDEVRDDAPGGAEGSRDNPSDETEPFGDRPQDQSDRGGHQRPTGDPANVLPRDFQAIRDRRVAAVQSNHRRAHHGGIEVDRHEERDEVDDRESDVEEPESEHVRGSGKEEDGDEKQNPDGAGNQQGEEREEDESLLLAQDAEAHFGELPADPKALEETELSRRGRIRRGRDRRRGGPHGNRAPMRPPPLEPSAGLPLRGELDRAS